MAPDQSGMPRANVRVPTNLQESAELLARERDTRNDSWSKSRVVREALKEYLPRQPDLPGEARDLLDDDLLANAAGEGELTVEPVEEVEN